MRTAAGLALLSLLAVAPRAHAQAPQPSKDWPPCNRCLTTQQERDAAAKAKTLPFKPRDFSGVWGLGTNGFNLNQRAVPPMTAEGQARYGSEARPRTTRRATRQRPVDDLRSGRVSTLVHVQLRHGIHRHARADAPVLRV